MEPNLDPIIRKEHDRLIANAASALAELSTVFHDARSRGDIEGGQQAVNDLSAVLEEIKRFRSALSSRERFMADLRIVVHGESEVSLEIPAGWSRARVISEAYEISAQTHGKTPMDYSQLKVWQGEESFVQSFPSATPVHVLGIVPGTENKSFQEQRQVLRSLGLEQASPADIVAAHMVFHVATGEELLLRGYVFISCLSGGYLVNQSGRLWHVKTAPTWGSAVYIGTSGKRP